MPADNLVRRALKEALSDWRHEMRGRGAGARVLACLRMLAAVPRLCWHAWVSFREPPFRNFRGDVFYAVRSLSRSPGFTAFSVASLAAGLAATTAVCSLIIGMFLTPLDVPHLDRLVNLEVSKPATRFPDFSWAEYLALRRADTVFAGLAASAPFRPMLAGLGTGEQVGAELASGDYFNTLGVGAEIGRVLQPSDDRPDAPPVVVISDRVWRRQFDADAGLIGKTVKIADVSFVVVGISPPSFHGADTHSDTALWIPLSVIPMMPSLGPNYSLSVDRADRTWLSIRGWLRPGTSADQASSIVAAIGHGLDATSPNRRTTASPVAAAAARDLTGVRTWSVLPTSRVYNGEVADRQGVPVALAVIGLVGLVLLVACTNLANLALARGAGRRHELAVRLALGATRWRLMREQLVESACVTMLAVVPAVLAARVLMAWIVDSLYLGRGVSVRPIDIDPHVGVTTAIVAAAGAVTSFAVAGLWPAWQLTRASVRGALASDSSSNAALPRWKGRARLIGWQVVSSVTLVFIAVIIGEQIIPIRASDSRMRLDGLAVANVNYPRRLRDEVSQRRTLEDLLQRMRRQPGITSASLLGRIEFNGRAEGADVTSPELPLVKGVPSPFVPVTPDVFDVLGIPTRRGRMFDARDTREAPPAAVLSETTARALFGTSEAVGRTVMYRVFGDLAGKTSAQAVQATVVGVVGDIQPSASLKGTGHTLYVPYAQASAGIVGTIGILVRAEDPGLALAAVRTQVKAIDPELVMVNAGVVLAKWEGSLAPLRTLGMLASALGGLALLLAMAGLYGVLSLIVLRRRREIGLRMALGADRQAVLRMVLTQGLRPVWTGVTAGLFVAMIVRQVARSMYRLPGPAVDVLALTVVPILFLLAALVACVVPARRAANVDPNVALREL